MISYEEEFDKRDRDSEIISKNEIDPFLAESESITNILTAIVKTTQNSKLKRKEF